jgi:hypothetical protein
MLVVTGFKIGKLPVKYLGCSVNYEKAGLHRLQAFTGQNIFKTSEMGKKKNLSFAGRLQLISSVIFSIQNYRCCCQHE